MILTLGCSSYGFAEGSVVHSSFTITNESASVMKVDTATNTIAHVLSAVIVSSPSAGGTLKIFNSSFTVNAATVAIIGLGTVMTYPFNDLQLKGIMYAITANSAGVVIQYKN